VRACFCVLLPRLSSVAIFAQHLAIFGNSFSAFVPRLNMVAFHFFYGKMFFALCALPFSPAYYSDDDFEGFGEVHSHSINYTFFYF